MKLILLVSTSLFLMSCSSVPVSRTTSSLPVAGQSQQRSISIGMEKVQRQLSETASLAKIGKNGFITLYYVANDPTADEYEIATDPDSVLMLNIIKCKKYSIIKDGEKCVADSEGRAVSIPYKMFLNTVETLVFSIFTGDVEFHTKEQVQQIEKFVQIYGRKAADPIDLNSIESSVDAVYLLESLMRYFDEDLKSNTVTEIGLDARYNSAVDDIALKLIDSVVEFSRDDFLKDSFLHYYMTRSELKLIQLERKQNEKAWYDITKFFEDKKVVNKKEMAKVKTVRFENVYNIILPLFERADCSSASLGLKEEELCKSRGVTHIFKLDAMGFYLTNLDLKPIGKRFLSRMYPSKEIKVGGKSYYFEVE